MNLKIKTGESSKKNSLKIAFLLYFLISVQFVFAQNQTIDLNMTDKPLSEIFKSIEKQADISVDFDETQINIHQKISVLPAAPPFRSLPEVLLLLRFSR